jgi:hypothetical protein
MPLGYPAISGIVSGDFHLRPHAPASACSVVSSSEKNGFCAVRLKRRASLFSLWRKLVRAFRDLPLEAPRCRNCLPGDAPPQDGLAPGGLTESPALNGESEEQEMYATIRRYEGVDESRSAEITNKANENLIPRLSELPGFSGYFLFEPVDGVLTSISLFETSSNLDESNRVAAKVLQEENLQSVLPNPPKITSGKLMAHKMPEFVGV